MIVNMIHRKKYKIFFIGCASGQWKMGSGNSGKLLVPNIKIMHPADHVFHGICRVHLQYILYCVNQDFFIRFPMYRVPAR